jgi:hypothetical protein
MTNSPNHTTASSTPPAETTARAQERSGAARGRELAALLICFAGDRAASKARRPLEKQIRAVGDVVFDTTILRVDEKHGASVYDPRRIVPGALTPMLTWGVFGLLTGGVASLVISAVLGAILGGLAAYRTVHHATKAQLERLGRELPPNSSILLTSAETSDPQRLLQAVARHKPTVASAAAIADDLTTRFFGGAPDAPGEAPSRPAAGSLRLGETPRLTMILFRYHDPIAAKNVAARLAKQKYVPDELDIELLVRTDASGRRHVTDPKFGSAAIGKNNIVGWGGLGLVCGAIAGATGDGGIAGFLTGGFLTALFWGLFGLAAGALYGLWAGRAISARRLKGIGNLLAPGTSTLLAWTDRPLSQDTIDTLDSGESERLLLTIRPTEGGAVLVPAGSAA